MSSAQNEARTVRPRWGIHQHGGSSATADALISPARGIPLQVPSSSPIPSSPIKEVPDCPAAADARRPAIIAR